MGLSHSPRIVTNGLVLALDAGNTKSYPGSGTTWTDLSGSALNGTLNGPTYNSDNLGNLIFDGSNDTVTTSSTTISLTAGFTAMMGIKWNNFGGGSFQFNAAPGFINFYNGNSSNLRWETYQGNATSSTQSLSTGKIYFVAGTFSGVASNGSTGTAKIYINGTLDKTATLAAAASITSSFTLGEYAGYTNGTIYNFIFYNRELIAAEIQQNFNALRGRFGL